MRRCLSSALILYCLQAFATLSVSLDANRVSLGESVRLNLTYDPAHDHGTPDFTPLQTDFIILATEQSMSYTVTNGQAHATGQWIVTLQPKKQGILLIPGISMGQQTSTPTELTVNPTTRTLATNSATASPSHTHSGSAKLNASLSETSPYLHQEVLYTVRLLSQQPLMNVRYRHPHVDDAIVFPLGEGHESQTTISGALYNVDEQTYAIFPQKSGPMTIMPPTLQAVSYELVPRPISLQAKTLTANVQPLPKDQSIETWLPSKMVRLREHYDHSDTSLVQGSTLVRTITLQAQGLVASLLPKLDFHPVEGMSIYPSKAETKNDLKQEALWGTSTQRVTYVLTQAGDIHVPALVVPWFNVLTKTLETARLPERILHVLPNNHTPKKKHATSTPQTAPNTQPALHWNHLKTLGYWIFGGSIIALSLYMLIVLLRHKKPPIDVYDQLHRACDANDPHHAKTALLLWAKQQWPSDTLLDLADIRAHIDHQALQSELSILIATLYQANAVPWRGADLWHEIENNKKHHQPRAKPRSGPLLPPINPEKDHHD